MRVFVALGLVLGLALTLVGLRAELPVIAELGPITAYRCLHSPYRYAPRGGSPDRTILDERPDAHIDDVKTVEVDLRTGQAIVTTSTIVYVLEPGQLRAVWTESSLACNVHLNQWSIIAEHHLG